MKQSFLGILCCILPFALHAEEISPGRQVYHACMKADRGDSDTDARYCISLAAANAKEAMNKKYQVRLAQAHKDDLTLEPPFNRIELKLIESQKAFLNYMEHQCGEEGFVGAEYTTGTGVGEGSSACELDLATQRLAILSTKF